MRRTVNCFFSDEDFGLSICFVVALPQICSFAWEGVPCECGSDRWPAILGIVNADAQVFKVLAKYSKYCNLCSRCSKYCPSVAQVFKVLHLGAKYS